MSTFGAEQKRAIAKEQQKLLSYLETGNKQVRPAEWYSIHHFILTYFIIFLEFTEFLYLEILRSLHSGSKFTYHDAQIIQLTY
jgi:hypothetical protein